MMMMHACDEGFWVFFFFTVFEGKKGGGEGGRNVFERKVKGKKKRGEGGNGRDICMNDALNVLFSAGLGFSLHISFSFQNKMLRLIATI